MRTRGEPEWFRLILGLPCYLIVRALYSVALPDPAGKIMSALLPRYGDWLYRHERCDLRRNP